MKPIQIFDAEVSRERALSRLRDRLGREPTGRDIEAEETREAAAHPLLTLHVPSAVRVEV